MMNFRGWIEDRSSHALMLIAATVEMRLRQIGCFSDFQYSKLHKNDPEGKEISKGVHARIEFTMQPPRMNRALFVRGMWVPGVLPCPIEEDDLKTFGSVLYDAALAINHIVTDHLRIPYGYPIFHISDVAGDQLVEVSVKFPDLPQVNDFTVCLKQTIDFPEAIQEGDWREEEYEKPPTQGDGG